MLRTPFRNVLSFFVSLAVVGVAATALLTGCGGSDMNGGGAATSGASFVFTDAATDDLSMFEVDLVGIQLKPVSGGTVSVLAKRQRIDFVSLESLAEIVAGVDLPLGFYTEMTLTFDFTDANAVLKDKTTKATIVDVDGNPITGTLAVPVTFGSASRPRILAAKHHVFMIDLDLDQAITVDVPNNRVSFVPAISAEFDPTNPKPIAATGYIVSADSTAKSFEVENRTPVGTPIGRYTVRTTSTTIFQIDGIEKIGDAGFADLSPKAVSGTVRVFAQGTVSNISRVLDAIAVEAGAGTPGNGQDWVEGLVTARSAGAGVDTNITVLGTSRKAGTNTRTFNTSHTIQLSRSSTKVLRRAQDTSLDTDAIQVGQRVMVFGSLSGTTLDATSASGVARMLRATYWGTANGATSGNRLSINLARIGGRAVGDFNFVVNSVTEVTPATFQVDVSGLLTIGVTTGSKIRVQGWMNPVAVSGDADCKALSFDDRTNNSKLLVMAWAPASATGITSAGPIVTFDVSGAAIKHVWDGFGNNALTNTPPPTLSQLIGLGVFRIIKNGAIEQHLTFSAFGSSLASRISAGEKVLRVTSVGTMPTGQDFKGLLVTVVLKD
ncbi:MAG: hypothetical protein KDC95_13785 [Planctomycetes bacterium]|nr:hypothetical protein [Planctomycetota bacterium]